MLKRYVVQFRLEDGDYHPFIVSADTKGDAKNVAVERIVSKGLSGKVEGIFRINALGERS